MGNFVRPAEVVLKLASGDTITVKRHLNTGETRERINRMSRVEPSTGRRFIDTLKVDTSTVVAYLLDWTLTDDDGQRVPIRDLPPDSLVAILDGLYPDRFRDVLDAVKTHEAAMDAAAAEEKKRSDGVNGSSPISTSPAAAVGATSGLPN